MQEITKAKYDELCTSKKSFIIDMWTEWCKPCRTMMPTVEKMAKEFAAVGTPEFYKCDCDKDSELPGDLKVLAIPTLIFIKDGAYFDRIVGVASESQIKDKIEKMVCGGGS